MVTTLRVLRISILMSCCFSATYCVLLPSHASASITRDWVAEAVTSQLQVIDAERRSRSHDVLPILKAAATAELANLTIDTDAPCHGLTDRQTEGLIDAIFAEITKYTHLSIEVDESRVRACITSQVYQTPSAVMMCRIPPDDFELRLILLRASIRSILLAPDLVKSDLVDERDAALVMLQHTLLCDRLVAPIRSHSNTHRLQTAIQVVEDKVLWRMAGLASQHATVAFKVPLSHEDLEKCMQLIDSVAQERPLSAVPGLDELLREPEPVNAGDSERIVRQLATRLHQWTLPALSTTIEFSISAANSGRLKSVIPINQVTEEEMGHLSRCGATLVAHDLERIQVWQQFRKAFVKQQVATRLAARSGMEHTLIPIAAIQAGESRSSRWLWVAIWMSPAVVYCMRVVWLRTVK